MSVSRILILFFICLFSACGKAQDVDSVSVVNRPEFRPKNLYIPAAMMAAGISLHLADRSNGENQEVVERDADLLGISNSFDDYAQFVPFAAAYAFEWAGMKPRTDWKNRTAIMVKGQIINIGTVMLLKKTIGGVRPDGKAYSFPSGHTAIAFAGATLVSMEYGTEYRWVSFASYTFATGIGVLRAVNDKHYFSDVLFGAGLGILSMKIAYWTHQYKWNRKKPDADPLTAIYLMPH